jgi:hypothetical protein
LAGKSWSRKWKFTTGQPGPNVESAAKSVVARLNHFRMNAGLLKVMLDEGLSRGCQSHAEYLAKNADTLIKTMASVNDEDPNLPWFTADGLRTARRSYVFSNAPVPSMQIDDLLATFSSRVVLLDPNLQRIGFGAAHDIGRGWRCVLDPNGGRGAGRVVLFPAPDQRDTPILGFDRLDAGEAKPGFPITVTFPERSVVRNAQATLMDAEKKEVAFALVSPERPLNDQQPRNVVGVYPLAPLRAGHSYRVNLSAIVNGKEWRQAWQFTTAK